MGTISNHGDISSTTKCDWQLVEPRLHYDTFKEIEEINYSQNAPMVLFQEYSPVVRMSNKMVSTNNHQRCLESVNITSYTKTGQRN